VFHYKRVKSEIVLSLDSGHICDSCREKLQPSLTNEIDEAVKKLLLLVSDQHPYSIILKGGGVKGLAFAGALLELENHFSFNAFAGTSAGAIAAVLLGAGYKPSELLIELSQKNFSDFKDASCVGAIINFISKRGLYPGDEIEKWISALLKNRIKKINEIQLSDLMTQTIVYASRIKDGTLVFDSQGVRKEIRAAYAARCSMSIPYYFIPKYIDGVRVFDGGLRNNFPLKRFIEDNKKKPFIGLYLKSNAEKSAFIFSDLFNTAIDGEEMQVVDANIDKVVVIDTQPIGTTDFELSDTKKKFLVLAGRVGALQFMSANFPSIGVDKVALSNLEKELEDLRTTIANRTS
jgi:predicted acylesterase/phospholipase RssA